MYPRADAACSLFLVATLAAVSGVDTISAAIPYQPINLRVLSAVYRDLDGDQDMFPDTGETGRLVITIQNVGTKLTGVTLYLTSDDPNVACITTPPLPIGDLAAGEIRTIGSLDPAQPGFTFRASDALQTISGTNPALISLSLSLFANEGSSWGPPNTGAVPIVLVADLDIPPGATQAFILGADGVAGTADDG